MYLKLFIQEQKIKDWLDKNGYTVSTILMIIKKTQGIQNGKTIISKYSVGRSFINTKICWKTEEEYNQVVRRINDILTYTKSNFGYFRIRNYLCYVERSGDLVYLPYYMMTNGETEERSLEYFMIDKTIERWIKEKF